MILRPHPGNGLLGWPDEWETRRYNACNEPCDFLIGPCACGAMHHATEDWVQQCLIFYGATIVIEQPVITGDMDIKAGDVVTFRAYEGQSNHWLTVGDVEGNTAKVYWFTRDNELKLAAVPVPALVKIETKA